MENRNRSGHFNAGSTSHLGGVEGPSEEDLSAIEGGDEAAGVYSEADIAAYRADERRINPQAQAIHNARTIGHGLDTRIHVSEGLDTSIDAPTRNFGDVSAQGDLMSVGDVAQASKTREIAAGEGAADIAYSDEEIGSGRRYGAVGFGGFDVDAGPRSSPFEKAKAEMNSEQQLAMNVGRMYLRQAGRCNHPLCQMKRARGLELMGQPVSSRSFGKGIESPETPIPSVATPSKQYSFDIQGNQDRKNPSIALDIKPKDPKGVEWQEAKSMVGTTDFFMAEDLLEHHHGPGDMDFARHLPWHPDYPGTR